MGKHLTNGSRARIAWRVPALLAGLMLVAVACTSSPSAGCGGATRVTRVT